MTSTPYCYFQDDDFLVWPLRSLYVHHILLVDHLPILAQPRSIPSRAGRTDARRCGRDRHGAALQLDMVLLPCAYPALVALRAHFERTEEPLLHSCFAWLGAGSFVSRAQVLDFLDAGISGSSFARGNVAPLPRDSLSLADNFYTTLRNEPPYALQHATITLVVDSHHGFSDGLKGETRNQRYIVRFSR